MKSLFSLIVSLIIVVPSASLLAEQKGLGDLSGISRSGTVVERLAVTGTIKEVKSGKCEHTTGRYPEGMHLIVQTDARETVNVHLGPTEIMKEYFTTIRKGDAASIEAFHSEEMPSDAVVAAALAVGGGPRVVLRDETTLRPRWANARGAKRSAQRALQDPR